ncbi:hypothetical protein Tco_1444042 [Tanacetum coccineum]
MDSYEQPSCLRSTFVSEALRKSDQMHQIFEKSCLAMTYELDDMIELPKSQPKKTYKEDLECEMVMVKVPMCMSWLDTHDEPIGDLNTIVDKAENPSSQSTPQVLLSFEIYIPPVTHLEEVEETIGIPMEVEHLEHMKLKDLGLNTCSYDLFLSSREIPNNPGDGVRINPDGVARLYLIRRSLEVLRKFHWRIHGGRFNQLSHVSSPLLSKQGEY